MVKYRVHLLSTAGKLIELVDFLCEDDEQACDAIEQHVAPGHRASIWQGVRLVKVIKGREPLWQPMSRARLAS